MEQKPPPERICEWWTKPPRSHLDKEACLDCGKPFESHPESVKRQSELLAKIAGVRAPLATKSVRVLIALDEDGRVRECVVLTDTRQADELYQRLRKVWGGANVAMASRAVDELPDNLQEKMPATTDIIQ